MTGHQTVLEIVAGDAWLMRVLRAARSLGLPDWAVGAGAVRNAVWDQIFRTPPSARADIDLLYFDPVNTGVGSEQAAEAALAVLLPGEPWSVHNQARMHMRNDDQPYRDTADAIAHWLETPTAVAVRLRADDRLILIAPHGVADLLAGRVRPTPRGQSKPEEYRARLAAKGWQRHWPGLTIEDVT